MQAPVEERGLQGQRGGVRRLRLGQPQGRVDVVREGLGDGPEDQADAHTGLKQHREPREVAELGPVVELAKPDLAVAGQGQPDGEGEKESRHEHVEPAEVVCDVAYDRRERAAEGVRKEHPGQNERRRDGDRDVEYDAELLYLLVPRSGLGCLSLLL